MTTTDKQRILARLQAGHVVNPVDYQPPHVIDGGKPILRVAARINDLRNDGWHIDTVGTTHRCADYALMRHAEVRTVLEPTGQLRMDAA